MSHNNPLLPKKDGKDETSDGLSRLLASTGLPGLGLDVNNLALPTPGSANAAVPGLYNQFVPDALTGLIPGLSGTPANSGATGSSGTLFSASEDEKSGAETPCGNCSPASVEQCLQCGVFRFGK